MAEGYLDQMGKLGIGTATGVVAPDAEEAFLWKKLPRELQNRVLCCLPLQNLFQMRCVCKAWRNIVLHRDFATMYDAMHISDPSSPATVYINSSSPDRVEWSAYDYTQNKWQKRTTLPSRSHSRLTRENISYSVHPVGGLLVFRFWRLGVNHWVVWNPLTNKWKTLPPCKTRTSKTTVVFEHAFVADERFKRYKILMAHNPYSKDWRSFEQSTRNMVTEVYDSATGVWTQSESSLQSAVHPGFEYYYREEKYYPPDPPGVLSNGVIYFVSSSLRRDDSLESVLYCFDIKSERWHEEFRHGLPSWSITAIHGMTYDACKSVFEWDCRLMTAMVHPLDEEGGGRWELLVYERDLGTRTWVETGIKVPDSMVTTDSEFFTPEVEIVAEGNHLVLGEFRSRYGRFTCAVYRKAQNCWTCSPSGQFDVQDRKGNNLVLFKPRLDWRP
ncbi:hypothetical protein KC19_6G042700 [Ceratodon purpureus]|uniref:F-box domain-containing protein n=1 Tax=Ceratodon purpureus TaxID=3225 RepID=A0A8T0HDK7_CERPU|nr:hypothetical protein KC19_6G042700 [Ceratodon purpureus]